MTGISQTSQTDGCKSRLRDILGIAYPVLITAGFLLYHEQIGALTRVHPNIMSFIKFALLATYGECVKARITNGYWLPGRIPLRMAVWGCFGIWISADFRLVDAGVSELIADGNWWAVFKPLSLSIWGNILSGYALMMMFTHYWIDHMIEGEFVWPWQLLGRKEAADWARIVMPSILIFWVPAHTVTFALPVHFRVICAAYLSVALGLILSFAGRRSSARATKASQTTS
nr:hypothetical protein [uncultured Cohaesibacter sp.]